MPYSAMIETVTLAFTMMMRFCIKYYFDEEKILESIVFPIFAESNDEHKAMPNPSNKLELLAAMADGYAKLNEQIAKMSEVAIAAHFDFAADPKKCGVRWQYDHCLRDLLIHLYEWQVLMREFVNNIREGHPRDYLPDEYRKNYHEMDKMLVEKHQNTSLKEAQRLLQETHEEMLRLAESFTEEELFTKGYYKNTYTTDMAAYFVSVTSSPYGQAVKLLKTHQKNLKK